MTQTNYLIGSYSAAEDASNQTITATVDGC